MHFSIEIDETSVIVKENILIFVWLIEKFVVSLQTPNSIKMSRQKQPSNSNTKSSILIKFNWGGLVSGSCYNYLNPIPLYITQSGLCSPLSMVRLVIFALFSITIFTSCSTPKIEPSVEEQHQKKDTTASAYDPDTPNDSTTFDW